MFVLSHLFKNSNFQSCPIHPNPWELVNIIDLLMKHVCDIMFMSIHYLISVEVAAVLDHACANTRSKQPNAVVM